MTGNAAEARAERLDIKTEKSNGSGGNADHDDEAGCLRRVRRSTTIAATALSDRTSALTDRLLRAFQKTAIFSRKSAGTSVRRSPKRSRIWLVKMMTAIPAVKPVTTGSGIYLIQVPKRSSPAMIRIAPAIAVASSSPS